eukprot:CAMPEP_0174244320 /NCGR_PEP_ID=MMETSP0417-20130205/34882_1 /TAXON_ID=242541 /ORGANISM="Mayorella sp, Strain BSH-02190019" /LENGTH=106 /DNA_ID=CAMNT_0015323989 /DNA_START=84 /DNA_END=400 /DNA_ORIENTATION=+
MALCAPGARAHVERVEQPQQQQQHASEASPDVTVRTSQLWLRLLQQPAVVDVRAVARLYRIGRVRHFQAAMRRADAAVEREFSAHFPFSYRLIRLLDSEEAGEDAL